MSHFSEDRLSDELREGCVAVAGRASGGYAPLELDQIKLRALTGSSARGPRVGQSFHAGAHGSLRIAVAAGPLVGGAAAFGGSTGGLRACLVEPEQLIQPQYCPPSSQQPGKPKDPGPSKCGQPKTK